MIELGDGSMGMLPEEWLKKYGMLADLATGAENGSLQFSQSQAGMLDALLAAQPEIRVDAAFEKVRQNLRQFEGVVALDSPPGFHGELRPYQREGLGWLDYLQRFGFGGILADDMGLGKTIQVLALSAAAAGPPPGQGAVAGGGPPLAGLQLDAGGREVHAEAPRARLHRARPPCRSARRSAITT